MNKSLPTKIILSFLLSISCYSIILAQEACCFCNDGTRYVILNNSCDVCAVICSIASLGVDQCLCESTLAADIINLELRQNSNGTVSINWTTENEVNNAGFAIQRSQDGESWQNIGFISGKGSTKKRHAYAFKDHHPLPGINYYRLEQQDFDGQSYFTSVKSTQLSTQSMVGIYQIFPNPAPKGHFSIYAPSATFEQPVSLRILNFKGQVLLESMLTIANTKLSFPELTKGIYVVQLFHKNQSWEQKLLIP